MNSPTEPVSLSAADPFSVDLDDAFLPSIDIQKTVAEHPMAAALIAAAAGAGLMGLLTLAMRDSSSNSNSSTSSSIPASIDRAERAVSDVATRDDLADLRDQLTKWASGLLAAAPSRGDAKRQVADASDNVTTIWNEVRDQATGLAADLAQRVRSQVEDTADRLRPKVSAAVDLAKDNPIWLGAALAGLTAIVGACALLNSRR